MPPPALRLPAPCRHGGVRDVLPLLAFLLLPALPLTSAAHSAELRTPSVGGELFGETMPLRHGRRVYRVDGLQPSAWYEVKISYPASIPSSFFIRLVDDPDSAEDTGSKNRRLLNTEKIIFKAGSSDPLSVCSSLIYLCARIVARSQNVSGAPFLHVIVTVEPEGVVAKPNVPERELALFNIVCDELMHGIPRFSWWVGIGAVLCIMLALLAPLVLPLDKLLNYEPTELCKADTAKMS